MIKSVLIILLLNLIFFSAPFKNENFSPTILRSPKEVLVFAHKGASAYEEENSFEAFDLAIKQKADFIELDIRKTKDQHYIVFHNSSIKGEKLANLNYDQLNNLTNFEIPKLKKVLERYSNKIKFNFDLKEQGYENEFLFFVLKYIDEEDFIITSSEINSILLLKETNPRLKTGFILIRGEKIQLVLDKFKITNRFKKSIELCIKNRIDYFIPNKAYLTKSNLRYAEEKNIRILVWSVNNEKDMKTYLSEEAIKGIITNSPDILNHIKESL